MSKVEEWSKLSEHIFEDYLKEHGFDFVREYKIETGSNFDFYVIKDDVEVYCDVKIFTKSTDASSSREPAKKLIRDDIVKLRKKFGKLEPKHPCILVSMNFTKNSISGYTMVDAMYGDSGITIAKVPRETDSEPLRFQSRGLHHLHKGNAEMREGHNSVISGILGFNALEENMSYLFHNEYANIRLPNNFFPDTEDITVTRGSIAEEETKKLTQIHLIPY